MHENRSPKSTNCPGIFFQKKSVSHLLKLLACFKETFVLKSNILSNLKLSYIFSKWNLNPGIVPWDIYKDDIRYACLYVCLQSTRWRKIGPGERGYEKNRWSTGSSKFSSFNTIHQSRRFVPGHRSQNHNCLLQNLVIQIDSHNWMVWKLTLWLSSDLKLWPWIMSHPIQGQL